MVANCDTVWREISNYIDGEGDPSLRSSMEEHFRGCPRCASVLAGTRNVVALYGDERMLELPAGFSGRLQKRLAGNVSVRDRERARGWSNWSAWLVPLAALVLIVAGLKFTSAFPSWSASKSLLAAPARDMPPDMKVVVTARSRVFHAAGDGCPFIHDKATARTISAGEALQQGYVPCSRCLRQYLNTRLRHHPGRQVAESDDESEDEESHASLVGKAER